jgi:hypothetical protein
MKKMQKYDNEWGNYKSDKHKSKSILREEIRSILISGKFTKKELIKIKNYMLDTTIKKMENSYPA